MHTSPALSQAADKAILAEQVNRPQKLAIARAIMVLLESNNCGSMHQTGKMIRESRIAGR